MTKLIETRNEIQRSVFHCAIILHVVAYVLLVFRLGFAEPSQQVIVLGILLGQCSAATILSSSKRLKPSLRILIPMLSAFIAWYGVSKLFLIGLGDPSTTWWAISLTAQTITTIAGGRAWAWFRTRLARQVDDRSDADMKSYQFPIRALILWTTVAAIGYAIIESGIRSNRWGIQSLGFADCLVMALLGVAIALSAIACVLALATKQWKSVAIRTVITFPVLIGLGWCIHRGAKWAAPDMSSDAKLAIALVMTHSAVVFTMLLVSPRD